MVNASSYTAEFESVQQFIGWVTKIPWGKYTKDNLDIAHVKAELEKHHYGLQPVKNTILEYLSVVKLQQGESAIQIKQSIPAPTPVAQPTNMVQPAANAPTREMSKLQGSSSHAPVLCFVGIQGVGKTSMAKSIAISLGRPFIRISLGAMGSSAQLRGVARTESGAEPGQIIKALVRAGTMNPLILLDEIDKTSSETGLRADLMAALLEILDPEQNATFVDHYLDFPLDLSQVMFITTANNLGGISAALLDRLEIIRFTSYTDEDKVQIARNYMLPKVREATGLTELQLSFDDDVWPLVVRPLGFDAGVRELERTLTKLARKVALLIVEGKGQAYRVTKDNFSQFIPEDIGVYS
jgi:ATP-dependent Lon protease